MARFTTFGMFLATLVVAPRVFGGAPPPPGDHHAPPGATRAFMAAVNALVATDVGIPPADTAPCPLDTLPASRAKLLPLLPRDHRELIAECARGRTRIRHAVHGLDLLSLIEDADVESGDAATIRAFFDERTVDVAVGSAVSAGPYPIAFDWAIVLDTQSHTLFSFIINCRD